MIDVINLALPFFGLIFIGFACGKLKQIPDTALAWMNFFIVYVALPALFYRILAQTPLEEMGAGQFYPQYDAGNILGLRDVIRDAMSICRVHLGKSTMAGLSGSYIIGYMRPGLALATMGPDAAVRSLIFCFDTLLLFSPVPFMMALASPRRASFGAVAYDFVRRITLNPLVIATAAGIFSAAMHFEPPAASLRLMDFLQNAAARMR